MNKAILILAILFTGCSVESKIQTNKEESQITDKAFIFTPPNYSRALTFYVIRIDNCEYLFSDIPRAGGYMLCHKGNCNNPIHLYNKEKD